MELRTLRSFVEVVRCGGFSQAAKVLFTTQSNVSKSVRLLEEELGCQLLERIGHRSTLTDPGRIVYDRALGMLAQREGLIDELDALRGLQRGVLRLGLPPIGSDIVFAPKFAIYQKRYPGIGIQLVEHGGNHLKELLLSGEIDVAGVMLPLDAAIFDWKSVRREPIDVLISVDHPLSKRKSLRLDELAALPFVLFEESFSLNHVVRDACKASGFNPTVVAQSSQIAFILELVAVNLGITFLPRMIALQRKHAAVRRITITAPTMEWHMALVWQRRRQLSQAARAWIDLVGE